MDYEFTITYGTRPGQELYIVGSCRELGSWNPQHAHRMRWMDGSRFDAKRFANQHVWVTEARLPFEFEYKYLVKEAGQEPLWESCENRRMKIGQCMSKKKSHTYTH
jgi:hypothetical protein